jgi:quinol monooxygenase YgiN
MIVVSGEITIEPADREAALEATTAMVAASLAEDGCVAYGFWADPADPAHFRVFEEWSSQDALATHFAQPHMTTFLEAMGGLSVTSSDVQQYTVSDKRPVGT